MYWLDVRQRAKLLRLAHAFLDRTPDEQITHAVAGYMKPRTVRGFLINLIPGAYGADFRHYWLITTTRRVVFVSLTSFWGKPTGIEWQRAHDQIAVTRYRRALLSQLLELRRRDDGVVIRFHSPLPYRPEARAIAEKFAARP